MQKENSPAGQRNIHAILQQRRLQHIHGICIRNLQQPLDEGISWEIHVRIYDQESSAPAAKMIFQSEAITFCRNPTWSGFRIGKCTSSKSNMLHLELWMQKSSDANAERALVWTWDLLRLRYIAEKLYHGEIAFVPNALILQINGSFYSFAETFSTDTPHGNCPPFNLDEEKVSYNIFSIRRMVTSQKSIALSQKKSSDCVAECRDLMEARNLSLTRCKDIEDLKTKIKMIRLLLDRETEMLKSETDELENLEKDVKMRREKLTSETKFHKEQQKQYEKIIEQSKANILKTAVLNRQLSARRIEVLSELAYIFPIDPYTLPSSGKASTKSAKDTVSYQNFTICGIHLPEAESLLQKEDAKNAVAMGYVSQMLHMISFFLVIPLRYPLLLRGSQTSIVDNIIDKIQERDRIFPLYVRTSKERFLFDYGMYLLNKNIAQLRLLLGIGTPNLRPTLANLKNLLEVSVRNAQPTIRLSVRQSRSDSKSPVRQPSPKISAKSGTPLPTASSETLTGNGAVVHPAQSHRDKVEGKSAELNNMRVELLGSKKASKPVAISPLHHKSLANRPVSTSPSLLPTSNGTSSPASKKEASFLTGLEDLENDAKIEKDPKKPLDIAEARNELFKTRSGRPAIVKAKNMTVRTVRQKEGVKSRTSTATSSGSNDSDMHSKDYHGLTEDNSKDTNTVDGASSFADDLDLC